jgi:hypothetical protein
LQAFGDQRLATGVVGGDRWPRDKVTGELEDIGHGGNISCWSGFSREPEPVYRRRCRIASLSSLSWTMQLWQFVHWQRCTGRG